MTTYSNNTNNYIVLPSIYEGTAFEDLFRALKNCIEENSLDIKFIGLTSLKGNKLTMNFDDNSYFEEQLEVLSKLTKSLTGNHKILFLDYFNPGFGLIMYYCQLNNINPQFGSLIHGSSFLKDDAYGWEWLKKFEKAWIYSYNVIYSPSVFLKNELRNFESKVKVYPFGIDGIKIPQSTRCKEFDVVFPHRLEVDKGIEEFICLVNELDNVNFLVTCPQEYVVIRENKYHKYLLKKSNVTILYNENYYEHLESLSKCKIVVSFAKQENFGYSILKSALCGAFPILPNRLCYPEMYPNSCLYNSYSDCKNKILEFLSNERKESDNLRFKKNEFSFLPLLNDFFYARN